MRFIFQIEFAFFRFSCSMSDSLPFWMQNTSSFCLKLRWLFYEYFEFDLRHDNETSFPPFQQYTGIEILTIFLVSNINRRH